VNVCDDNSSHLEHGESSANEMQNITNQNTSQAMPESLTLISIQPTCRTLKDINYRQLSGIRPYTRKKATSVGEGMLGPGRLKVWGR